MIATIAAAASVLTLLLFLYLETGAAIPVTPNKRIAYDRIHQRYKVVEK